MAALDAAVDHGARVQRDEEFGQGALFGGGGPESHEEPGAAALPDAPAWSDIELLNAEKEALGLFWTGHPIDAHAADLREFGARTIADLQNDERRLASDDLQAMSEVQVPAPRSARGGEDVTVGGIVSGRGRSRRAKATRWRCSRSRIRTAASKSSSSPRRSSWRGR